MKISRLVKYQFTACELGFKLVLSTLSALRIYFLLFNVSICSVPDFNSVLMTPCMKSYNFSGAICFNEFCCQNTFLSITVLTCFPHLKQQYVFYITLSLHLKLFLLFCILQFFPIPVGKTLAILDNVVSLSFFKVDM